MQEHILESEDNSLSAHRNHVVARLVEYSAVDVHTFVFDIDDVAGLKVIALSLGNNLIVNAGRSLQIFLFFGLRLNEVGTSLKVGLQFGVVLFSFFENTVHNR